MLDEAAFRELIQQVRGGDAEAATELVREFEPEIRRVIRIQLTGNELRRLVDSVDIWQSVMCNFFVRAAAGQFELDKPIQLFKLLKTMARNKIIDHARRQPEQKFGGPDPLEQVPESIQTPSQIVAWDEMLVKMRQLFSEDETWLSNLRAQGMEWNDIVRAVASSPPAVKAKLSGKGAEALRKHLERAMNRIGEQLGLEKVDPS